jgi:hypothetical protein
MKAGLTTLIQEIKKQLERINAQIETEKRIHAVWSTYADCTIKTAVIHQSIGLIRGLEIAKESLEYTLKQAEPEPQMELFPTDEWMAHDMRMKQIAGQIDIRGGMVG